MGEMQDTTMPRDKKRTPQNLQPVYNMVSGATQNVAMKFQGGGGAAEGRNVEGSGRACNSRLEKSMSGKEYLMQKLEPGAEERALSLQTGNNGSRRKWRRCCKWGRNCEEVTLMPKAQSRRLERNTPRRFVSSVLLYCSVSASLQTREIYRSFHPLADPFASPVRSQR
ncbi:hypothetical protein ACLOJK_039048 [Asimina triloba]